MDKLFDSIKRIVETECVQFEEVRSRGDCFNVFDILGLSANETRTHSAFIAELLRPNGSHGMQDIPLSLFLKMINSRVDQFDFNTKGVSVITEKDIGSVNYKEEEGGRLDIIVESGKKAIIIENKVYADDQEKQLIRYHNYATQRYGEGNYLLLYLCLNAHEASDASTKSEKTKLKVHENYYPISYNSEIQQWIRDCLAASYDKPLVRETLRQYLDLIIRLTNGMGNNNEKIIELMMKNPSAITRILKAQDEYKQKVIETELIESFRRFASDPQRDMELSFDSDFLVGKKWSRLCLRKKMWRNATIAIIPDNKQSNYWIGILHKNPKESLETKQKTLPILTDGTNSTYPFGSKWLPGVYRWLYDAQTIEDILSGKFIEVIGKLIDDIIAEAESSIPGLADL